VSRRRAKSLQRSTGTRELCTQILVFCEGKTEKIYLDAVAREARRTAVQVSVVGQAGVPSTVVGRAKTPRPTRRPKRAPQTEVWAVCDRDEHPCFHSAAEDAAQSRVLFAWSNPCVELWGLLHLGDHTAEAHRHACQQALKQGMAGYDHERNPRFDEGVVSDPGRRHLARARALTLHRRAADAEKHRRSNPTTTLWVLVDVIGAGGFAAALDAARARGDGSAAALTLCAPWLEDASAT
jgi:hypothetical protein